MTESKRESSALTRKVSDADREQAVASLSAAFAEDAINVDEFERRVAAVYEATNAKTLEVLTRDLPAPVAGAAMVPASTGQSRAVSRRPRQRFNSVLSAVERTIDGTMPERLYVQSFMGALDLDLRRADFPPGVTEIHLQAIMGQIEIELPEHVRLENDGHAFMGAFSVRGRSREPTGDNVPVVRITGRAIMGSIEVERDD